MITLTNIKTLHFVEKKINKEIEEIAKNTANTWQENRQYEEKKDDTSIGKIAEDIVQEYINNNFKNYYYKDYDSFRTDNFKKHAPFDGLLIPKGFNSETLEVILEKINNEIDAGEYGKLSDSIKKEIKEQGIKIVEIKSTRATERHKSNGEIDKRKFLNDDFLTYPKYLRKDKFDKMNEENYYKYCKNRNPNYKKEEELTNMVDVYIRIYIDENEKYGYLIGFIDKENFFNKKKLKKMKHKNKSEHALYWATNLQNGFDIDYLDSM